MQSIAVEIKLECKACANMQPINAMNTAYVCPSCFTETKITVGGMLECLNEIYKRVTKENDDRFNMTGNAIPFFLEGMLCVRLYGGRRPEFYGVQLDLGTISKAAANGHVIVKEHPILVRTPPAWFSKKNSAIRYLVGEDPDQVSHLPGDTRRKEETAQPVLFSCLSCGAGLPFKGDSRFINCTYCQNTNYIPDALWLKFHPVAKVRRWYMVG